MNTKTTREERDKWRRDIAEFNRSKPDNMVPAWRLCDQVDSLEVEVAKLKEENEKLRAKVKAKGGKHK